MLEAAKLNQIKPNAGARDNHLLTAFFLMLGAALVFFGWLLFGESLWSIDFDLYMLPWIGATAIVLAAPTIYLIYRKKFDFFNPLVSACWLYWFPSFVGGGLLIAAGIINPYQLSLLSDPRNDLIWTYVYIMLGFAGMTAGFFLPIGRIGGEYASRRLPLWDWETKHFLFPAIIFLIIGSYFYFSPFFWGIFGFTLTSSADDSLSSLNFIFTFLNMEAGFLAAMYIFRSRTWRTEHLVAVFIIAVLLVSRVAFSEGSRSSILTILILLLMAYLYSGRRVSMIGAAIFGFLAVAAVLIGMIYGTTFRTVKGTEEQASFEKQIEVVGQTIDTITAQDTNKNLAYGFVNLAERIDGISSVAVVVSNYERLKPYEADYGLEDNIFRDLWTSFIPRFVWADKPKIFDSRAYSDLYFDFSGNSYALTPVGDLLRNFGTYGVPIGMFFVGIFLRFAYAALIENQKITVGRATAYYLFLVSLSYEGFYGTIFIYGWRIFGIAFISFVVAEFLLIPRKKVYAF